MALTFEMKERDGLGRLCILKTAHGPVTTPALLPVINPNKMTIPPSQMKQEFGAEMIITNSYIIRRGPDLRERALKEGVHKLVDFDGPIMTDSGAFQAYVYGSDKDERPDSVQISPSEIVEFQRDIGVDIGTILDVITPRDATYEEAKKDVEETISRAKSSVGLKGNMALNGTVQGSVYPELREKCARALGELDIDVHPIGGVVPFLEAYRYGDMARAVIAAKKGLPPSRPVHLFGAGHPHFLSIAVLLGCDLFDSSSYMKYALDERMMFNDGTRHFGDLDHLGCSCPVCSSHTIEELRKMQKPERTVLLARHNLHILFGKIRAIRQAIHEERLWEMAERDARSHPALLDVMRVLGSEGEFLERFEQTSRASAFMHTGPESRMRPIVRRYRDRLLKRYSLPKATANYVIPETTKPYSDYCTKHLEHLEKHGVHFVVESYFGPAPLELDLMYPIAQSMSGQITEEERKELFELWAKLEEANGITFEKWTEAAARSAERSKGKGLDIDLLRVTAVANMQFGPKAAKALLKGKIAYVKSREGRIRNIIVDGEHVLSMRAHDGMYTLKAAGAKRIAAAVKSPQLRVIANKDSAPFVAEGKNLFCKFVLDCDPDLRPGDEAVIVDPDDKVLAVGRLLMNREEMLSFKVGVAVKNREHI